MKKKLIYIGIFASLLVSCTESLEDKAAREALQRSGLCMAARGLSTPRDAVLTICEEHRPHEPPDRVNAQTALFYDGRQHLGHDSRQER